MSEIKIYMEMYQPIYLYCIVTLFIQSNNISLKTTDYYGIAGSTRLDMFMFGLVFDRC